MTRGWRHEAIVAVIVVCMALVALILATCTGLCALMVCRLLGTSEGAAHSAEMIASGLATGVFVACFFVVGRWSRRADSEPGGDE